MANELWWKDFFRGFKRQLTESTIPHLEAVP